MFGILLTFTILIAAICYGKRVRNTDRITETEYEKIVKNSLEDAVDTLALRQEAALFSQEQATQLDISIEHFADHIRTTERAMLQAQIAGDIPTANALEEYLNVVRKNQEVRKTLTPECDPQTALAFHASLHSPQYTQKILQLEAERARHMQYGNIEEASKTNSLINIYRNLSKVGKVS